MYVSFLSGCNLTRKKTTDVYMFVHLLTVRISIRQVKFVLFLNNFVGILVFIIISILFKLTFLIKYIYILNLLI